MRWPSGPGQGGASRPGSSRPSLTQCTMRRVGWSVIPSASYLKRSVRPPRKPRPAPCAIMGQVLVPCGSRCRRDVLLVALVSLVGVSAAEAQYFGRNKVQYRTFAFKILKTEHFDLYYYPEEAEAAQIASRLAERWYARLSRFFTHELRGRQVIILYASSAQFRQTNAVEELIGEGTGGADRSDQAAHRAADVRARWPTPITCWATNWSTRFSSTSPAPIRARPTCQAPEILQFPAVVRRRHGGVRLARRRWTRRPTMWLRDAALREKLPHIKDLDDPKYFPYRWGHAFWAYIGAKYGDRAVASLLRSGGESAHRPRRPGAAARHRSRHADRGLARGDPPVRRRPCGRRAAAHERAASGRVEGDRRRPIQRRAAPQSRRPRSRVLFGARPVLDRVCSWPTRRPARSCGAVIVGHRSALRQPGVPEFGRRLESGLADARRGRDSRRQAGDRAARREVG